MKKSIKWHLETLKLLEEEDDARKAETDLYRILIEEAVFAGLSELDIEADGSKTAQPLLFSSLMGRF